MLLILLSVFGTAFLAEALALIWVWWKTRDSEWIL